jgi:hypothetical protein
MKSSSEQELPALLKVIMKHATPEKFIGLDYSSLTLTLIEKDTETALL